MLNFPFSELIVTPDSADTETSPPPLLNISILVPMGKATEVLLGTEIVVFDSEDILTIDPASTNARV